MTGKRVKPDWLKVKLPGGNRYRQVKNVVLQHNLHTICSSGQCPNLGECWGAGTATFMILGEICTRTCNFCATKSGSPLPVDKNEPASVAKAIQLMKLKHAVITSVDRDDLEDKGGGHWVATIKEIKRVNPKTTLEVLIPDFGGIKDIVEMVVKAKPNIISHNVETVKRITPAIRSKAEYNISLNVIKEVSMSGIISKSGIMLGLGEKYSEVLETMDDLTKVGCKIFTIGQYLQPTKRHMKVQQYITPNIFERLKEEGMRRGFSIVESAPLVRSSYHAEKHVARNRFYVQN